ncbi:MAG: hypothetical protein E7500_08845 [Ruminococcus sp.]|nr:hypothetical protein [Ruminococcus sp.]
MGKFLGTKKDNLLTVGVGIGFLLLVGLAIALGDIFLYILGALIVLAWIIFTRSDLKAGKTNWFIVVGFAVLVLAGIVTVKGWFELENLKNDKVAKLENTAVEIVNDELKLELESEIDKKENEVKVSFFIALGGGVLFCVGHIIKACSKQKTVVVERVIEAQKAENTTVSSSANNREYIFCQNCGEKLSPTAKFCKGCGQKNDE